MGNCCSVSTASATYTIVIQTNGSFCHTAATAKVSVELIGTDGTTGKIPLPHGSIFHRHFQENRTDVFPLCTKYVGLPDAVRIYLDHSSGENSLWMINNIIVTSAPPHGKEVAVFPVFDWVYNEIQVTRGAAQLPHNVGSPYVKSLRRQEIDETKGRYAWRDYPGEGNLGWNLPSFIKASTPSELPRFFLRENAREIAFIEHGVIAGIDLLLAKIKVGLTGIDKLEDYHKIYSSHVLSPQWQNPDFLDNWQKDYEMGRQTLNGVSPLHMEKCTKIPEYFNVTDEDVSTFLDGKTLKDAMQAGILYLSDYYPWLEGVQRNKTKDGEQLHCSNAMALFMVKDGKFLPIAIQLEPNDKTQLYTPKSFPNLWLLAKMHFRCAQSNVHEWMYHFFLTHDITEAFCVSLFRCLPRSHPIYKLLRPHLRTTLWINTLARETLVPDGSKFNQTLSINANKMAERAFLHFKFEDLNIPKVLKKKGLDDPKLLPNFFYRDDATTVWNAIEAFFTEVIKHFYKTNQDIVDDFELQGWLEDAGKNGIGWQEGNTHGFPTSIDNIEQLIEICTTIAFTASAQHCAVNFGQFETYKFTPNCPVSMRRGPFPNNQEISERDILDSLPSADQALIFCLASYVLSSWAPDDVFLDEFKGSNDLFTEDAVQDMQEKFIEKLHTAQAEMEQRNEDLDHPYTFLLPNRISKSIAI